MKFHRPRARGAASELRRLVPRELQQFFDRQDLVVEALLQRWLTYDLAELARVPGGEIEQENGVMKFRPCFRLQISGARNQAGDIGDGAFRRMPRRVLADARLFMEIDNVKHYLALALERVCPERRRQT